jgi:integrase
MRGGTQYVKQIGNYPDLSYTAAKRMAQKIAATVALGQFENRKGQTQPTVREIFQAYLTHHQFNPHSPKADAPKVKRQFDRFVFSNARFCLIDSSKLDVEDCVPLIRKSLEVGQTTSNNLLRNCKAAVNWAMRVPLLPSAPAEFSHWKIKYNPFTVIPLQEPSKEQDERFLSHEELAEAYNLLETVPWPAREILRFYFLSGGIRLRQLSRLTWEDIDESQMTMVLRDYKGRRAKARVYTLPITKLMLQTLHKAAPGNTPLSTSKTSLDGQHARYVTSIGQLMKGRPFTAKHIRKTGWSLMRDISLEAKRYWLSDDMSSIAQKHYDFFDHRKEILKGMLKWQCMCEGRS